jgi:serine/threonine-protein kinase
VPAPLRDAVYVGHSSGNELTVAVAVSGAEAAAYICDGETIEAWLDGTVSGEQVDLQGPNGAQLTATLSDRAALGVVTGANGELPFSAAVAGPPAGIYEGRATVDGQPNRIGWIVLPSGRQVGINNVNGEREPAPELDPNDIDGLEIEGVEVEVQRIGGRDPVVPR